MIKLSRLEVRKEKLGYYIAFVYNFGRLEFSTRYSNGLKRRYFDNFETAFDFANTLFKKIKSNIDKHEVISTFFFED